MRLSLVLGFATCFLLPIQSQAAWDIFQSYVIIDSGSGNQYLAGGINADGASAFAGTDLGDFTTADALTLSGGELKTYKNGSSNVCGGTLNYRVYPSGDTPGAFTALALPYDSELGGGDQKWATTGQAIDLLDALTPGDYVLELYWESDGNDSNWLGCGETKYDSDSGNNFTATFSIHSAGACGTSVNFDGYDYETVQIGDQCWFAENLRSTVYADGTAIPEVTNPSNWNSVGSPPNYMGARCDYDNDVSNVATYGRLYNFHAVKDTRGLCPTGWHVPTDDEWTTLETYLGANGHSGAEGTALKSTSGWSSFWDTNGNVTSGNGTDDFGFSAPPAGKRTDAGGFCCAEDIGYWWSSTPVNSFASGSHGMIRYLQPYHPIVFQSHMEPRHGISVRCLREVDSSEVQGCTDPEYIEYDASATTDDGSCVTLVVEGCTDTNYTEYDASANTDDGSCVTQIVFGCTDDTACNYDATATNDDGSCESLSCAGCMDPSACNHDASATIDDASCESLSCAGCMDPSACNYDDTATIDDASCESLSCAGCMDPSACNYNDTATIDDASCESLSLESIVVDISATTIDAADGHAALLVNSGNPTALALAGVNGAPDYSFDQPGSIEGIAPGVYNVTATDDSGCESNALTLVMTYALCCDCGVSDIDTDGICDDEDNCTDRTAPNYDDPNNTDCILGDD